MYYKIAGFNTLAKELDPKQSDTILQLIDLKTQNDMEKVILEIRKQDARFEHFEKALDSIKWFIATAGIVVALITKYIS